MKLPKKTKDLSKVDPKFHDLYTKVDDVYVLETDDDDDDDDSNSRVGEFRKNNIALQKQNAQMKQQLEDLQKQMSGFDPEMLEAGRKAQEKARNDEERKLLAAGRFDDVFDLRLRDLKGSHEKKLNETLKVLEAEKKMREQLRAELRENKVWAELSRELGRKKVSLKPTAQDDFMSRALRVFDLADDGKIVALQDGKMRLNSESKDYNTEDFIQHILDDASHLVEDSSTGPKGGPRPTAGSTLEIDPRDATAFGRNIDAIAKGKVTVRSR